jgi:iron(III) transport system ATP-binding protein
MNTILELRNISKSFDSKLVISNLSLTLAQGSIGCLLGASGCGKTTALRTIAGFEAPNTGQILINNRLVANHSGGVPPEKRRIGMVFQDYALFPHLTVKENVIFGLRRTPDAVKNHRVSELLEVVGMSAFQNYFPHELSGGQQQRIALARALAPQPEILLLDEPFSNLDVALRERLSMEVRDILKQSGISAILVTHNQHEAFAMADAIGVMHNGRLEQWDSAYNLYHRPASLYVANFIGEGVLLPGKVIEDEEVKTGLGTLKGHFTYPCRNGCPAQILIRPEDVVHDHNSKYKAKVLSKNFRGPNILYTLLLPSNDTILSLVPSHHNHKIGEEIGIVPQVEEIILFEEQHNAIQTLPKSDGLLDNASSS